MQQVWENIKQEKNKVGNMGEGCINGISSGGQWV